MKLQLVIFHVLLLSHASSSDMVTLLTLKSMISDPLNALSSWSWDKDNTTTLNFCRWRGVTCGRRHPDRVTSLNLDSLNLTAPSLPPQIGNLTFLKRLRLANNNFRGSIPHELGRLSRLTYLNLSINYLDGEIPDSLTRCSNLQIMTLSSNQLSGKIPVGLTRCSNLQLINLLYNELSGEIPRDIGSLSQLQLLGLSYNNLTGTIPPSLGNISSLVSLYLGKNNLVGSIPASMGKLSSLQTLVLGVNELSGNVPSSLYNLSSLQNMELGNNLLTGTLPPNMFNTLPNLQKLHLYDNQLQGTIPFSLSNATNIKQFEIKDNNFIGTIPSNLGNLKYLELLSLSFNQLQVDHASDWDFLTSLTNCSYLKLLGITNNRLGSMLPPSIANLSSTLQKFYMGSNHIAGSIPDGIGDLASLTIFTLEYNLLTGRIPATIGKLQQLHLLSLGGNRFTGQIPYTIGNLTLLNLLYLQRNSLNGSIPASLGKCMALEELDLSQNMLTGVIPKELLLLSSLSTFLNLSHNLLTGPLPLEVGKLTNLNSLNISHNKLSGEIPTTLGECQSLEYLYMQGNFFDGVIPQSLSQLKGLRELDLSQNNLSGECPAYMGSLGGLQYLNLSYNDLDGEVPDEEGIFRNSTEFSVYGNKNLCGGNPKLHLPPCHTQYQKTHHRSLVLKVVIIPILGACLLLILFLVIFISHRRLKNQRKKTQVNSPLIVGKMPNVSYAELLKATDGFSLSNLIGVGTFGSVYKGILNLDERTSVAVKVLNLQQRGATKSFLAECEVLKNIRHRNLLKIITSCSSVDFNGNDFKALVIEFMPNGSLDKWLHQVLGSENSKLMTLSFDERLNIAIDVASALEYLHHHHGETPIVHCDLKPSNILLDANMCACVGDFGLARFICNNENQSTTAGLKGTIGYVAPEYGMGSQASTYGDVYSYGILLLELFTGRRPTDEMFIDDLSLRKYAEIAFPKQVMDIVDPRLQLFENDQEARDNNPVKVEEYRCLVSMIGIGLSCSKEDPRERMEMKDITKELCTSRDVLRRSGTHE